MNRDQHVSIDWTWEDEPNDRTVELTLHATVTAYDPGVTNRAPEDCYPPEGGEIDDLTADAKTVEGVPAASALYLAKVSQQFMDHLDANPKEQERVDEAIYGAACDE